MIKPLALAAAVPLLLAATQAPVVDSATAMRCSAAFGIVASEQARGIDSAKAYPELGQRGREFFVQAGARLMDEEQLTREQMQARFKQEVDKLQTESIASPDPAGTMRAIMTPCLALLDATVPARP
jgi:urease accessory protein UreF